MSFDITGIGSIFDFGGKLLDKIFPNKEEAEKAKFALLQLQQAGEFKEMELQQQVALEQIKTNAVEAASGSLFIGGWRPGAGWCCVAGLAYTFLIQPIGSWIAIWYGKPVLPALDTTVLMELLLGMLGLGGLRSYDKKQGTASK